ncbi:MAG: energy-coupled thiamine transporter ThiT, partial [Candidatus Riflebacteria bacterium]|nr:energy-coupled thiamine transporter ThiT [Candidatus Riflebacteria bacterium]
MEGRSGEDRSREATVVAGLAIALTVVLHQVRLFRMPQGGSITLGSAIPLWIVARRFGPVWGALSGVGAGVLLFVLGGAPVLHPVQPILDYVLAFGSMGLASLPRSLTGGVALSILVRFTIQVVSGVVFFATYAPSGVNALTYSMVYNSYLVVD